MIGIIRTNKTKQNKHELQIYPLSLNLLHDDLIESFILSVSFVWKKKENNVFVHHECDCTCRRYSGNQPQNEVQYLGSRFTEMTANHISSNLLVSAKLSITAGETMSTQTNNSLYIAVR